MMKHSLEEKLSALFDGELDTNEVDEILDALAKDTRPTKKIIPICISQFIDK